MRFHWCLSLPFCVGFVPSSLVLYLFPLLLSEEFSFAAPSTTQALWRECEARPLHALLKEQASLSASSPSHHVAEERAEIVEQVVTQNDELCTDNDELCTENDELWQVVAQNRRLVEEVLKRELSEIRTEFAEGRADVRVLGVTDPNDSELMVNFVSK